MTLSSSTIATGIAALSISGVTVKNVTAIPEFVNNDSLPILFPNPEGWILGGNSIPGPLTMGPVSSRYWEFDRTFDYVFLYAPAGGNLGMLDKIAGMAGKLDLIMTALTTLDLADVDVMSVNCTAFGALGDPNKTQFYGCHVQITLREVLNP
jgi:hypothetical protein